jgi:hypothetical protein
MTTKNRVVTNEFRWRAFFIYYEDIQARGNIKTTRSHRLHFYREKIKLFREYYPPNNNSPKLAKKKILLFLSARGSRLL